jgi:hypothetical protein
MTDQAYTPTLSTSQSEQVFHSDKEACRNYRTLNVSFTPSAAHENRLQLSLFDPVKIPLTKGYVAIVDPIDSDLAQLNWNAMEVWRDGHLLAVYAKWSGGTILLHRVILDRILDYSLRSCDLVDHEDGNGLNDRRTNLRLATYSQNGWNSKRPRNNTSGYKCISWEADRSKWRVQIAVNGKRVRVGRYDTIEEAHAAYCEAAHRLHGEFARTE